MQPVTLDGHVQLDRNVDRPEPVIIHYVFELVYAVGDGSHAIAHAPFGSVQYLLER